MSLSTIGDHLRKKRLDLGLLQREVAVQTDATECSIYLWETNRVSPTFPFLPKIIEFLGYCPVDPDDTPGRRLTWARQYHGYSQSQLALSTGMDPSTLSRLERGWWLNRERLLERVRTFLESTAERRGMGE